MSKLPDHQRALILRDAGMDIGHTDGQPFAAGSFGLQLFPHTAGRMSLGELEALMRHFDFAAHCGRCFIPTAADRFVFRLLKENGAFEAWQVLQEAERDAR
ncbi:MAG: hypothetical protein E7H74_18640 [Escherichia coli]|nr:hypothetical protein [Escherichia coli]